VGAATFMAGAAARWLDQRSYAQSIVFIYLLEAISLIGLWTAGVWWMRRAKRGQAPWFDRLPLGLLTGSVALLFALDAAAWMTAVRFARLTVPLDGLSERILDLSILALGALTSAVIWMWWCDWPDFGSWRGAIGAAGWAARSLVHLVAWDAVRFDVFSSRADHAWRMQLFWSDTPGAVVVAPLVAAVCLGLYWLVARLVRRTRTPQVAQ
jgi:hypothetical protein